MAYRLINSWHISIAGFSQRSQDQTGLERLWLKLQALSGPTTVVLPPLRWCSPWAAVAEQIWRLSSNGSAPAIYVYAYSWGVGYGLVHLARQLDRRGLRIKVAVCCDGIKRTVLVSLRWLALCRCEAIHDRLEIRIPPNVDEVHPLVQRQDRWIRGHRLVATSPDTVLHSPLPLHTTHAHADDHEMFRAVALSVAGIADPS